MLRDRIAQAPSEPEPALSLLRLGMRVRNLALEAADLAMQPINRLGAADPTNRQAAASRGELFTLLLEPAAAKMNGTVAEGESVYAMVVAVAADPQQRIEYLLAYGDWLREHALHRAVELSVNPLRSRAGRLVAPRSGHDASGLGVGGPAAGEPDRAARRLRSTPRKPTTRPARPTNSGRRHRSGPGHADCPGSEFPFSEAAIEAALSAAAVHMNRGDARQALADLIAVHHAARRGGRPPFTFWGRSSESARKRGGGAGSLPRLTHIIRAWRPAAGDRCR